MSILFIILVLAYCLGLSTITAEWTFLSNDLRWKYEHINPNCSDANGRNPCEDIRICKHAAASLALQGWPAHCGSVGKGIPKVCCGLPLVFGEDLMKKIQAEKARNRVCGRRSYQSNASETEVKYFEILRNLPDMRTNDPNEFDPPLDLSFTPILIPPLSYPRPRQEEFPWMVAIFKDGSFLCGGSLIDRIHILTSAHCFANILNLSDTVRFSVYIGDIDLDGGVPFEVFKIKVHEDFVPQESRNDVAILTLQKEILVPSIAHVCLPAEDQATKSWSSKELTTLAWTKTEGRKPGLSLNVSEEVSILPNKECCTKYRHLGEKGMVEGITKKVICAVQQAANVTCEVDIGGTLLARNHIEHMPPSRLDVPYVLIGLISFPYACVEPGYPKVYTSVAPHLDWIRKNTE